MTSRYHKYCMLPEVQEQDTREETSTEQERLARRRSDTPNLSFGLSYEELVRRGGGHWR